MKLLLDSHTFIWWDNNLARLSPKALALCQDTTNTLLLSVASVWEMQIKVQLGKLKLPVELAEMVTNQETINRLEVLPVNLEHALALSNLRMHHKDPFDRMLIAQAIVEDAIVVSGDKLFAHYPVTVEW